MKQAINIKIVDNIVRTIYTMVILLSIPLLSYVDMTHKQQDSKIPTAYHSLKLDSKNSNS